MKYYIIVHKSGKFFPQKFIRGQTGIDFDEGKCPPRLWAKKSDAERWLTVYCKGVLQPVKEQEEEGFGPYWVTKGNKPMPGTARPRDEFKVTPVDLVIIKE